MDTQSFQKQLAIAVEQAGIISKPYVSGVKITIMQTGKNTEAKIAFSVESGNNEFTID